MTEDANDERTAADRIAGLTAREKQVLRLMAVEKLSNAQIAKRLVVSIATVEAHVQNIQSKVLARS